MSKFTDDLKGIGSSIKKTATDVKEKAGEVREEYNLDEKAKKAGEVTKKAAKGAAEGISSAATKIKDNQDRKKQLQFKSIKDLKKVIAVVNDCTSALNDTNMTIEESHLPKIMTGVLSSGVNGQEHFLELFEIGGMDDEEVEGAYDSLAKKAAITGGVVAGVIVLSAPVLALAAAGALGVSALRSKKVLDEKNRLLDEANKKHKSLLNAIENEAGKTEKRSDYLKALNILIEAALKDLQDDIALGEVI